MTTNPYQPLSFDNYQQPPPVELARNPVGPITMSAFQPAQPSFGQTQIEKPKEFGINKPTPFTGDRTKVKKFIQECLIYLEVNEGSYSTDKLCISFMLSFMTDKEALDWKELYLEGLEDPATGKVVFPTFSQFLADLRDAFQPAD
jgi:hypothetical protein